jgi:hypothetical protein
MTGSPSPSWGRRVPISTSPNPAPNCRSARGSPRECSSTVERIWLQDRSCRAAQSPGRSLGLDWFRAIVYPSLNSTQLNWQVMAARSGRHHEPGDARRGPPLRILFSGTDRSGALKRPAGTKNLLQTGYLSAFPTHFLVSADDFNRRLCWRQNSLIAATGRRGHQLYGDRARAGAGVRRRAAEPEDCASTYQLGAVARKPQEAVASEGTPNHTSEPAAEPELRPPDVVSFFAL